MVRCIVVDDEPIARESLKSLLESYCPEVQVTGESGSVEGALALIRGQHPELLFLDIQLLDGTGFDILKKLDHHHYKVIFVTAFEEYAITAFKFSAIDYLLKPVNPEELKVAVEKVQDSLDRVARENRMEALLENLNAISGNQRKVVLRTNTCIHIVSLNQIIRCKSEKNYTVFSLTSGIEVTVSRTLKDFEEILAPLGFFRAHQSHLVNTEHMRRFDKSDGGLLVMSDRSIVPVSHRKKEELMRLFAGLNL